MTPSCYFADGKALRAYHQGCEGRLQWHHVLEKQRLKQEFRYGATNVDGPWRPRWRNEGPFGGGVYWTRTLDDILGDERNRIWLCDRHHQFVTNHRIYIPRSAMESVEEFAKDYGVTHLLDRVAKVAA